VKSLSKESVEAISPEVRFCWSGKEEAEREVSIDATP